MTFTTLTLELIIGFLLLFFVVKIVGKKIINQITPFPFIASIVLSELLGNALYDEKIGIKYIIYAISLWGLLLLITEYLSQKFLRFRQLFEGKPAALIENGRINFEELKKNKLNINLLQSLLRQSEIFSIREVAFCYLETNGAISVLKKPKYQKTTLEDFNLIGKPVFVPVTVIRDGKVLWDEIHDLGYDEAWLKAQLVSQNISHYKDVFIAEWLERDGMFAQTYSKT